MWVPSNTFPNSEVLHYQKKQFEGCLKCLNKVSPVAVLEPPVSLLGTKTKAQEKAGSTFPWT